MEADFWIRRWEAGEIGFHQAQGNDLLARHWALLRLAPGSRVFVPLCGKSVDMAWLAGQGHRVIGSELSPLAVAEFFRTHGLDPAVRAQDGFEIHDAGGIEI